MAYAYHLKLAAEDLQGATVAILPGDPGRVGSIAAAISPEHKQLAANREYTSFLACDGTVPVLVTSTGIGGPSTSIAIEELASLGVRTFLRVGTTGAIQPGIALADIIITTAAVRLDGASGHYAPKEYPAVAHHEPLMALIQAARELKLPHHIGITASSDTFFPGQERYSTYSGYVIKAFQGSLAEWKALHVLNYEMESATLLTMCAAFGLRAGCVTGVVALREEHEAVNEAMLKLAEQRAITAVIAAMRNLRT